MARCLVKPRGSSARSTLQARTLGTLAYRNGLERRRPRQILASVLLITAIAVLVIIACGSNPAGLTHAVDRLIG